MRQVIEMWRDVPEYEGYYQVSNLGNIRSVPRIVQSGNSKIPRTGKAKSLSPNRKRGYKTVVLYRGGVERGILVHRIVATVFIPNPENKLTVNHINGDKGDNRVENLEWATQSENIQHAYKTGLSHPRKGDANYFSKLTWPDVDAIRNSSQSTSVLADSYNVTQESIRNIKTNRTWKQ